ncbi:MAG: xanthine dehydrogenase accessory protein XdhC [Paracoccaceae bacterium]
MGFDIIALRNAISQHGRVARVVIAEVKGSSPREVGASMLVWNGGQSGTIGGGVLEFELTKAALATDTDRLTSHALGPDMGQCCGGAVKVLTEVYDAARVKSLPANVIARGPGGVPLAVQRLITRARNCGQSPKPVLVQGWFIEPVHQPTRELWIWGAGHVGRALVDVMSPMPDLAITWVDTGPERFPEFVPAGVNVVPAADPAILADHAPIDAEHLILTYSHTLDLELCNRLLRRGFGFAGVIGSKTKWARFKNRLAALGHAPVHINQITCPIGEPSLGKHPQMIAIGVAAALMKNDKHLTSQQEKRA